MIQSAPVMLSGVVARDAGHLTESRHPMLLAPALVS